ncbi:MAG TPA: cyclic nucleotide-binding domain-containing protein [Vicinamibacterales bacterium]|nr:cyclic nucleotide-binding domain-containing protein [Vicinamibacterales bacterium]
MTAPPEFLEGLNADDAAALMALGTATILKTGAVLFDLGSPADFLYLVERGRINLTLPMEVAGHQQDVLVEERLPGQMLGWSALIPPHRFTLKATAPLESEVIGFARAALFAHFAANPQVGYQVTRNVGGVIGQRLQILQAMWLREMRRVVQHRYEVNRG